MYSSPRSVVAVALGLVAAGCSLPGARVQVGYLSADLSGAASLEASGGGFSGTAEADIEDSLGLRDAADSLYVRAEVDAGPLRVTASGFSYQQSGSGLLETSFGDLTIGTMVDSDVRLGTAKASATFDLLDLGVVRLSPGVGVDVFDLEATVEEQSNGIREELDEILPLPMLVLQGEVDLGPVALVAEIGGMDAEIDDFGGRFWDAEAMLSVQPVSHVELFAGYRWISIDAHGLTGDRDFTADFELQGWFAGGGFAF